jgi:salicylate hydroxylase
MTFHIIIVGGGIAGFAAAIALRGPNRQITILEQSSLNKEIGTLISFQPNASRILQSTWGLDLQDAWPLVDEGFRIYNTEGRRVNSVPLLTKTEYGGDRLLFHRREVHEALGRAVSSQSSDLVGGSVKIRTASRVVKCDKHLGTVTLENGNILQGDLVIGADGMHVAINFHFVKTAS